MALHGSSPAAEGFEGGSADMTAQTLQSERLVRATDRFDGSDRAGSRCGERHDDAMAGDRLRRLTLGKAEVEGRPEGLLTEVREGREAGQPQGKIGSPGSCLLGAGRSWFPSLTVRSGDSLAPTTRQHYLPLRR